MPVVNASCNRGCFVVCIRCVSATIDSRSLWNHDIA